MLLSQYTSPHCSSVSKKKKKKNLAVCPVGGQVYELQVVNIPSLGWGEAQPPSAINVFYSHKKQVLSTLFSSYKTLLLSLAGSLIVVFGKCFYELLQSACGLCK